MKQKVVIRVNLNSGKKNARTKALKIAVGVQGVESVSLQGEDSSQIVVVGNDIDSVHLTSLLRKKVGSAELMSLSPISYEGDTHNGIQSMITSKLPSSVEAQILLCNPMNQRTNRTSIASIFPPDRSDTESDTCPRFYCFIDTIFPPARSPSQSESSENHEEIFPIDPFIATSSRRTRPMRVAKALVQAEVKVQAQDGNADDRAADLQQTEALIRDIWVLQKAVYNMPECPNNEPGNNLLIQTSTNLILMVEQDSSFGLVVQDFKGEAMEAMCNRVEGILQLCKYCNSDYANGNQNYVCIGGGFSTLRGGRGF
nr:heavy metal-associated isoprenylated plant protein 16 [Quercus suber]